MLPGVDEQGELVAARRDKVQGHFLKSAMQPKRWSEVRLVENAARHRQKVAKALARQSLPAEPRPTGKGRVGLPDPALRTHGQIAAWGVFKEIFEIVRCGRCLQVPGLRQRLGS